MIGRRFSAIVFDLDGVLADSARLHEAAWRRLADELGIVFDPLIGERLKGVDRMASLDIVLENSGRTFGTDEKQQLAARKNGYYRDLITSVTSADLLPGAETALLMCRERGFKTALASASKNAGDLIAQLGIAPLFDAVADAALIARGKPDPEIFLTAARLLGVAPLACIGVEDAAAGVIAIKAAGMYAVGIGRPDILTAADEVIPTIAQFDVIHYAAMR